MIVYHSNKSEFREDVFLSRIEEKILSKFIQKYGRSTSSSEITSWRESLRYMSGVLEDPNIPNECGVAIEYKVPQTSKRIDFILSGYGAQDNETAIIIELKQWTESTLTPKDGVVLTRFGKRLQEVSHPSYQAWAYASLIRDFNEYVYTNEISVIPCAYLHNYTDDGVITHPFYTEYLQKAPVFLKYDAEKLREFIKRYIRKGDQGKVIYSIDSGRIRPSKQLAEAVQSMLSGNPEFVMVDDQKLVYETAIFLQKKAFGSLEMIRENQVAESISSYIDQPFEYDSEKKQVLIVKGGPGTGKSVVAINLLGEFNYRRLLTLYVSKNAAPRAVYESKLTGLPRASRYRNLFKGSGAFIDTETNTFDVLIVDEAHRLNEKSGLYGNQGDHQIKEIINAARCSIFFIDEDQRVTLRDVGQNETIRRFALEQGAEVHESELSSQFRCDGSDGYITWLDQKLQIRETANEDLKESNPNYLFQVSDSVIALRDEIFRLNANNKARIVAGYCWNWVSKKNPDRYDIEFPDVGFSFKWNLETDGSLWIISPESVHEIGCIHTCQGLEVDHIGVIIGPDLLVRNGQVITNPEARARTDNSLKGWKKRAKTDPEGTRNLVDKVIKNTYRTLMTRGMKSCLVWSEDEETREWFRQGI